MLVVFGQDPDIPNGGCNGLYEHTSCSTAKKVCFPGRTYIYASCTERSQKCSDSLTTQYFSIHMMSAGSIFLYMTQHTGDYVLYGPMNIGGDSACQSVNNGQTTQATGNINVGSINGQSAGYYILKINTSFIPIDKGCGINIGVYSKEASCEEEINCESCISSFSPGPGEYIVSGWIKGDESNINSGYSKPKIVVYFDNAGNSYTMTPVGNVIDGWQQMRGEVTIPTAATGIYIKFICESGSCYFDDIRFLPKDASMESYVYNPRTRKMMTTLDGRNYGTFYEYDEEGKLIRVKKETERGIMTIKENRNHIQINQ